MQKPFSTQPELFITSADTEHASLPRLDGTEAVLDWVRARTNHGQNLCQKDWPPELSIADFTPRVIAGHLVSLQRCVAGSVTVSWSVVQEILSPRIGWGISLTPLPSGAFGRG